MYDVRPGLVFLGIKTRFIVGFYAGFLGVKVFISLYIQSYLLSEMFGTPQHLLRRLLGVPNIYSQDIWRILGVYRDL